MVKKLLLLCLVAFCVSFGLSFLMKRDIKIASLTGLINVPATFLGLMVVNRTPGSQTRIRKQRSQQKLPLKALPIQIHQLERRKQQLRHSLSGTITEKHRIEANLNFLKAELSQIYTQSVEQRSYKQQLSQDLTDLKKHRDLLVAESHDLQNQIHNLRQRREELNQSLRSRRAEKQNLEARFDSIPTQLQQLQVEIVERQNQKQELERNLALLTELNPQLEEKSRNLQLQIQELENRKVELNQSLSVLIATFQNTESGVDSLQAELNQLQRQVAEQQKTKKSLESELFKLGQQKQHRNEEPIEELPNEWTEFTRRLPKYELQVLKALVEPGNPNVKIKKIAEENITMPELLIDLLNERAFNIIGDLIIEPSKGALPPEILEEYLTKVKQVVKIKEMN